MKIFFQISVLVAFGLCHAPTKSSAQKYGHLNLGNLMELLPEVAVADSVLADFRDSLFISGQLKAKRFEEKAKAFMQKRDQGELTRLQEEEQAAALEKEQQALAQLEDTVMKQVQAKRGEYLDPILRKIDNAISAVGKENGYAMIFDTSIPNTVLFVTDGDDVQDLVLKKLGLK